MVRRSVLGFRFSVSSRQTTINWLPGSTPSPHLNAPPYAILGLPLPQFQERFIRLYGQYLVADEQSPEEDRLRSITRMLGYEYQRYYGMDISDLVELVHRQLAQAADEEDSEQTPGVVAPMPDANWYADPLGRHELRYWDGQSWSAHVADGGRMSTDPLTSSAAPVTTATGSTRVAG